MGRLLAFLLGGLALALYAPPLFLTDSNLASYQKWCNDQLGDEWYGKLFGAPEAKGAVAADGKAAPNRPANATVLPGVYFFAASAIITMLAYGWANTIAPVRRAPVTAAAEALPPPPAAPVDAARGQQLNGRGIAAGGK